MPALTLITPTGGRPQAWALCQRWMAAQDYDGPVHWIVVDDGPVPQAIEFARPEWELEVVRPEPLWQPGQNTQSRNLLAGLDRVRGNGPVLIIEDDDHYAPTWLSTAASALEHADLVGETRARYYNVATQHWREHGNETHSSLCSTGLSGAALGMLRGCCQVPTQFIDILLWGKYLGPQRLFEGHQVTGIKGLPGRQGIGVGHHQDFARVSYPDPEGEKLRAWLGEGADVYSQWLC